MKKTLTAITVIIYFGGASLAQTEPNLLNQTGNVGIGTTSPTSKLSVRGSVRIDSSLTVLDSLVVKEDVRFNKKLVVDQKVALKNDVSVGQDLKVAGNANLQGNAVVDGNLKLTNLGIPNNLENKEILFVNENGLVQKSSFPALSAGLYSLSCLQLPNGMTMNPTWGNGPSKIFVACPNDVKVGIGTNDPRSTLDVRGTTVTNSLAIGVNPDNMTGRFHLRSSFGVNNTSTIFLLENQQKKLLELSNQGLLTTERIFIKNTTAGPSSTDFVFQIENSSRKLLQLQSNGLMRLRKIRVDSETWADFVFDDNYSLMSAEDLRTFISVHRHLPDVPAAGTVKEEGIDLAEMNKILLQKVEELTLYMLEQQQQMDEQQKQIDELKKTSRN